LFAGIRRSRQALVVDFGARGLSNLAVWDVLFTVADSAPRRAAVGKPVRVAANVEDAVANADLVISAVTRLRTSQRRSVVPHLKRNAYFFDVNLRVAGVKSK
jgi:3-hydroxyisobutyrate dehydrogenase-like beta-hydroxyacid dehydrogenase